MQGRGGADDGAGAGTRLSASVVTHVPAGTGADTCVGISVLVCLYIGVLVCWYAGVTGLTTCKYSDKYLQSAG